MTEHEILLLGVADALGEELLKQVAFVGGATVSLHLDALVQEVLSGPVDLRDYVRDEISKFIADRNFDYLIDSALDGEEDERFDIVEERFQQLAGKE